jgi:pyruvate kinase
MLKKLIEAGLDIVRINMSHAKHDQVRKVVKNIRESSRLCNRVVGILMDIQGPAIRTDDLPAPMDLKPGETIAITVKNEISKEHRSVNVNYDHLVDDLNLGDIVLIDNGEIHLKVIEKHRNQLDCEVLTEGVLGSRRHINLPGVRVNLPSLTDKDLKDIELGIEMDVDFFAMSFVREAADIIKLKGILDYQKASQKIIAKLEDQQGISNLDEIIQVADAIMVARGDLGIECAYEELPIIQRRMVKKCILKGVPVIVATHMLESMIENPAPTRAEITDVANAVFEQADAIMLSGETSTGKYPVECVEMMDKIARRIERSGGAGYAELAELDSDQAKMMKSACVMTDQLEARALVVFTRTGNSARCAAWLRPEKTAVYAFTDDAKLYHQLTLNWGTAPFLIPFDEDEPSNTVDAALKVLKQNGRIKPGETFVLVTEIKVKNKLIPTIQMKNLE